MCNDWRVAFVNSLFLSSSVACADYVHKMLFSLQKKLDSGSDSIFKFLNSMSAAYFILASESHLLKSSARLVLKSPCICNLSFNSKLSLPFLSRVKYAASPLARRSRTHSRPPGFEAVTDNQIFFSYHSLIKLYTVCLKWFGFLMISEHSID